MSNLALSLAAGVVGGAATALVIRRWPLGERGVRLAIFLAVAAGIYAGFGIADGRPLHAALQIAGALPFVAVAAGWPRAVGLLGCAWLGHGLWDLAHHLSVVGTVVPAWYPAVCFGWDLVLGAAALRWARRS